MYSRLTPVIRFFSASVVRPYLVVMSLLVEKPANGVATLLECHENPSAAGQSVNGYTPEISTMLAGPEIIRTRAS